MVGRTIGHYKIEAKLGEGGMGVVYRALDTRLQRAVAIKVLTAEGMASPERRKRFMQEARAASALNHPNIVHIYDIDQIDGTDFIAMEYVAGQTLAEKINRKGLTLAETLKYATPVAGALAKAHAAGIVHRDLKPANIMIGDDGPVKLLDFGLAKLVEPEAGDELAATRTQGADDPLTEEGSIVGTVAYMSPEQAEGKKVDARSDIFSFGSVLYEMVTGQRPFEEATKISTLSAILHKDPKPVSEVAPHMPGEMEKIITRCLRKDPERRAQHMDDVKLALEDLKEDSESGKLDPGKLSSSLHRAPSGPVPSSHRPLGALVAAGTILLVALAGVGWWLRTSRSANSTRGPILTRLTSDSGLTTNPALSPLGNLFAYASDRSGEGSLDIWVKQIAGGEPIRLTRDPADDHEPAFSPDGSQIAFRSGRQGGGIYLVSTLGGDERKIASFGRRPRFSPDGKWIAYWVGEIINPTTGAIYLVSANGGQPQQFLPNFGWMGYPIWSPDSKYLLFLGSTPLAGGWWVAALEGGEPVRTNALALARAQGLTGPLIPGDWLPDGNRIVFTAGLGGATNIWELPLTLRTWAAAGPLRRLTFGAGQEEQPSVGKDGRILFAAHSQNVDVWALPADANQGKVKGEIQQMTHDLATDDNPFVSRDGTKIVFASDRSGTRDLWLKDLATGSERRLNTGAVPLYPRLSLDGSQVAYTVWGGQQSAFVMSTSGGVARKVCENCSYVYDWAPDGTGLAVNPVGPRPQLIAWLDLASGQKRDLIKYPHNVFEARFSPDGRWIAFHAQNRVETRQIFVAPFRDHAVPEPSEWIPITDGEGIDRNCYWSPDGNLLYYQSERDGYRCIFARRLDPATKRPLGPPFPVYHSHRARRSLSALDSEAPGLTVARDKIVFSQGETTGNIWMAKQEAQK